MASPCNDAISNFEFLGRVLNETPQVKRNGEIKEAAMYPRKKEDVERKGKFTNKISMVRLCRGHAGKDFSWSVHSDIAIRFIKDKSKMLFRGFLVADVAKIRNHGLDVVAAANPSNPYHAHIVISDYDVDYTDAAEMVSEYLPNRIKSRLDRLRESMMPPFIINGGQSNEKIDVDTHEPLCHRCLIIH